MAGPDLDEAKNDTYAHPWYRVGRGSVRGGPCNVANPGGGFLVS